MKKVGVQPNDITYSVLIIACEKYNFSVNLLFSKTWKVQLLVKIVIQQLQFAFYRKDEAEMAFDLFEEAKASKVAITSTLCGCLTGKELQVILRLFIK